jgi:uncharacterized protein involved in exopolysaccharide biosynthesis
MAVELSDYMRRVLRWSWLIAVVTLVGGVIALLLTSQSSTAYVTTATVSPPAEVTTATQAQQYVNDFQAAAGSRAVQDAVNVETDVPRSTIGDRVTVNRVGDSGLVSINYQSPLNNDPKAEAVIESVVQNTLSLMYDTRVRAAERTVTAAEATIKAAQDTQTAAEGQVSAFLAARNYVSPADELASVQDQITQFQVRETESRAAGNVAAANTFTARLAELEQRRSDLGRDAAAYAALLEQVDQAKQQVSRAQEAKEGAARNVAEIKPEGNTRFAKRNEAQDRAATIWRRTLAVMLACFVLSVLLVAWLASLTPDTQNARAKAAAKAAKGAKGARAEEGAGDGAPLTVEYPEPADLEPVDLEPAEPQPVELEPAVKVPSRYRTPRQPKHDPDGISVIVQPS